MNRNYFLWLVAASVACLFLIFFALLTEINSPITRLPQKPISSPYDSYISGVGVIEASSGNIAISSSLSRVVKKIFVKEGDSVAVNEPLFALDRKDLLAELKAQTLAYEAAQKRLERLEIWPREEDVVAAEASMRAAKVQYEAAKSDYEMVSALQDKRSISRQEKNRRRYSLEKAQAALLQSEAEWKKITAGTWQPDLDIARLEVAQALANLEGLRAQIDKTVVRSPLDGKVLQINIHEGELLTPSVRSPAMVIGTVDPLNIRVSINQLDIPRFKEEAPAVAFREGDASLSFPLTFVQVDPLLINKSDMTNELTERVDTRVLQIIYRIDDNEDNKGELVVGQQMDVFIQADGVTP